MGELGVLKKLRAAWAWFGAPPPCGWVHTIDTVHVHCEKPSECVVKNERGVSRFVCRDCYVTAMGEKWSVVGEYEHN